jgi:hypothetical protein
MIGTAQLQSGTPVTPSGYTFQTPSGPAGPQHTIIATDELACRVQCQSRCMHIDSSDSTATEQSPCLLTCERAPASDLLPGHLLAESVTRQPASLAAMHTSRMHAQTCAPTLPKSPKPPAHSMTSLQDNHHHDVVITTGRTTQPQHN